MKLIWLNKKKIKKSYNGDTFELYSGPAIEFEEEELNEYKITVFGHAGKVSTGLHKMIILKISDEYIDVYFEASKTFQHNTEIIPTCYAPGHKIISLIKNNFPKN